MKTNNLLTTILLLFTLNSNSQAPTIQWQKCFGGTEPDILWYCVELANGGYMVNGGTSSSDGNITYNHGNGDFWIIKIDGLGNLVWNKCIGGSDIDGGYCISHSDGSSSIIGGSWSNDGDVSGNHNPGVPDAWIAETDISGNVIIQKCFGGSDYDSFISRCNTNDGCFLLAGFTYSNDGDAIGGGLHGGMDIWVVKLDSSNNIVWQKCYGGSGDESALKIIKTGNSYIIGGSTNSNDGDVSIAYGGNDYWMFKIDSIGDMVWNKTFGGSQDDFVVGIVQSIDGGIVLAGFTSSQDGWVTGRHDSLAWQYDFWLIKVDTNGALQWQKCYGGNGDDQNRGINNAPDGGFFIYGMTSSNDGDVSGNHGNGCAPFWCQDDWLVKIDSIGNIQWQKCLGGSDGEDGAYCIQTADSGFLFVGSTYSNDGDVTGSFNHGNSDAWVVKLSPETTGLHNAIDRSLADLFCYFNSFESNINVSFYANHYEKIKFQLLDIAGRNLIQHQFSVINGFNKIEIPVKALSDGIYFINILSEFESITKQIIIE